MNIVDEPTVTFEVDDTVLEIYPLSANDAVVDPHDNRTWPGPGIAVFIQRPEGIELRHFWVADNAFWGFIRQALSVAQAELEPEERRELLEALGEPER